MSEINNISTHTGPPGYKAVEPLGRVSRARGTVRATGEKGERCRETEEEPPLRGQIRIIVTAEMPTQSKTVLITRCVARLTSPKGRN